MAKYRKWGRLGAVGVLAVAALVAVRWYAAVRLQRITVGPDTTHVMGPLRDDGTVDYAAAVNAMARAGVTVENNAAVPLLKLLPPTEVSPAWLERVAASLGASEVAAPRQPGTTFVDVLAFERRLPAERKTPDVDLMDESAGLRTGPWKVAEHPLVSEWLDANAVALEGLHRAVQRPRYFVPVIVRSEAATLFETSGGAGGERGWSDALAVKAMRSLGAGDAAGALMAAGDILRLGTLLGRQPSMIEQLVAIGIIERGLVTQAAILEARVLTPEERATMASQLEGVVVPSLAEAVDGHERLSVLDTITKVARFGVGDEDPPQRVGPFTFGLLPLNFDPVLREANGVMDVLARALAEPDATAREAKVEKVIAEAQARAKALGGTKQEALRRLAYIAAGTMSARVFRVEAGAVWHLRLLQKAVGAAAYFGKEGLGEQAMQGWAEMLPAGPYGQGVPRVEVQQGLLTVTAGDVMAGAPESAPTGMSWLDGSGRARRERLFVVRVRVK